MGITEKLLNLKKEIEDAKIKEAEMNGELNILKTQLKNEFSIDTLEDAEKELKKIEKKLIKLQMILQKDYEKLEEEFNK
jgi:hypothetical protein